MSVNSYLDLRSSNAVLSSAEKSSISTSISTLTTRLNSYFGNDLSARFTFGSYTRDTILPRSMDSQSDIDFMVVFAAGGYTPQTYLDRLRRFVDTYYTSSEIHQSRPTIQLDLNHIRFELVPALSHWLSGYTIPDSSGGWMETNPNDFNATLSTKNQNCGYKLKPAIRLAKFWNADRGYPFESYAMERSIVSNNFLFCSTVRDHLFEIIERLSLPYGSAQWRFDRLARAKEIVSSVKSWEQSGLYGVTAEQEVKKLVPE